MEMKMPGEELVAKLWETVAEKGIGSLFKPWQMRREGRATIDVRREEILILAQAKRDAELIKQGELSLTEISSFPRQRSFVDRSLSRERRAKIDPIFFEPSELVTMAKEVAIADIIRRECNVANALLHAEAELDNDSQTPPTETIDDDWLFRWRDCASQVSSEELQKIWGKLLAGEIKAPGLYSLRTLEFLKNLSQSEAAAIAKLSRFVISKDLIFSEAPDALDSEGVSLGFLMSMQNLGVIAGVGVKSLTYSYHSNKDGQTHFLCPLLSNGMVIVVTKDCIEDKLSIPCFIVTDIGKQVLTLGKFEPHIEYLRRVGAYIKDKGFDVDLAKCENIGDTNMRYTVSERL